MAKLTRVGPDHPECCQANRGTGQCDYRRVSGSQFCPIHGGTASEAFEKKAELKAYRIQSAFKDRAVAFSRGSVKDLTDEIALMRVALETVFNSISNANEMLLYVDKIDKLSNGIQKLVESWQKIQERNKELLGRETVIAIFDQLMERICERVNDPDVVACLAQDGYDIISKGIGTE